MCKFNLFVYIIRLLYKHVSFISKGFNINFTCHDVDKVKVGVQHKSINQSVGLRLSLLDKILTHTILE